jgi:hypothetical protein
MKDRVVSMDSRGRARCFDQAGGNVEIPTLFGCVLDDLAADLELAIECNRLFGVVPVPVAKAILRNIEPARAAIDMAIRCSPAATTKKGGLSDAHRSI